uniref:tRNA pseudouridine(55) synthase n=1 Tax=Trichuris muris TaxID=70415 RepID=A0A5S6QIK3_TRIMR
MLSVVDQPCIMEDPVTDAITEQSFNDHCLCKYTCVSDAFLSSVEACKTIPAKPDDAVVVGRDSLLTESLLIENYKVSNFKLLAEVPICFSVRDRLVDRDVSQYTWKELLRSALVRLVEIQTGFQHDTNGKLAICCTFTNKAEDERLFALVKSLTGDEISTLGKAKVQAFIDKLDANQRNELASQLRLVREVVLCEHQAKLRTEATLLAGRYVKFSRHLYQTPWLLCDGTAFVGCVQDYLAKVLKVRLRCDDISFSAGGREDVDVRMLGSGRPFVVQCMGCRECNLSELDIQQIQSAVNASTKDISIAGLRMVTKEEFANLKSCETEKRKTYFALCRASGPVGTAQLSKLISLAPLKIEQKTPTRVLHRRTLATRSRSIENIHAWRGQEECDFFILITTEAGTYVKEFVHGDFGRTIPNVSDVLGVPVDLVELDVQSVDLSKAL